MHNAFKQAFADISDRYESVGSFPDTNRAGSVAGGLFPGGTFADRGISVMQFIRCHAYPEFMTEMVKAERLLSTKDIEK